MQRLNKIILLFLLIILFINQVYAYISISETIGSKIIYMINYWVLLMPIFFIYFIVRKYKYAYISLFLVSLYIVYKVVGLYTFKILFTMFSYEYFYYQLYIYYLTSWLIPLFSLIGVVIQIIEYKKLQDEKG
ncbi:hypothetical protein [Francisella philomiragia]|uniref:Putative membrane protein n=1 Tax=Francisella philomiragia TaxID=28110 RepID=A0A0B6D1W9_9GAMM|nr:hypothetical protein [Francisella philomiragia]AJI52851.1 putative membrane protein [Francisella philomiragia]